MNPMNNDTARFAALKEVTDNPQHPQWSLAWHLDHEVEYAADRLAHQARHIIDRMEGILRTLDQNAEKGRDASLLINTLGELQSSGPELDRLCAVLDEKVKARGLIARTLDLPLSTAKGNDA